MFINANNTTISTLKFNNRRPPTTGKFRRILKFLNKIRLGQHLSDDLALDADAFAVDDSDDGKTFFVGLCQIRLDYGPNVLRAE